jgi:hypothetical protein
MTTIINQSNNQSNNHFNRIKTIDDFTKVFNYLITENNMSIQQINSYIRKNKQLIIKSSLLNVLLINHDWTYKHEYRFCRISGCIYLTEINSGGAGYTGCCSEKCERMLNMDTFKKYHSNQPA